MAITPSYFSVNQTATVDDMTSVAVGKRTVAVAYGVVNVSSSGDTTLVAAVPGKRIMLLGYSLMANGAVNAHFRSATTPITGTAYFNAAGAGKVNPVSARGWARTAVGEALALNLSGAVAVGGEIVYAIYEP